MEGGEVGAEASRARRPDSMAEQCPGVRLQFCCCGVGSAKKKQPINQHRTQPPTNQPTNRITNRPQLRKAQLDDYYSIGSFYGKPAALSALALIEQSTAGLVADDLWWARARRRKGARAASKRGAQRAKGTRGRRFGAVPTSAPSRQPPNPRPRSAAAPRPAIVGLTDQIGRAHV